MNTQQMVLPNPQRKRLRGMKALALSFFVGALVLFIIAHYQYDTHPAWGYVGAFAEAAMVGSLADWFAVVALFRHPLGLPIPHTAIIPKSKERIADSLAEFVRDHFLSHEKVTEILKKFNVSEHLANWLTKPNNAQRFVAEAKVWVVGLIAQLDDAKISGLLFETLVTQGKGWNAAQTLGEALDLITKDNRHQAVFNTGLEKIAALIDTPHVRERVGKEINELLQENYPKLYAVADTVLVTSSMDELTQSLAQSLTNSVMARINAALNDPEHPWRRDYSAWMADYMDRLKHDEAFQASFNQIKDRMIDDPMMRNFLATIWHDIKDRLTEDLTSDQSTLCNYAAQALQSLGERLIKDAELRESVNQYFYAALGQTTDNLRDNVTHHISSTINAWDNRQLVEEIELNVGPDLQFIRINGTLVGGLVGLAIYALSRYL